MFDFDKKKGPEFDSDKKKASFLISTTKDFDKEKSSSLISTRKKVLSLIYASGCISRRTQGFEFDFGKKKSVSVISARKRL